MKRILVLSFVSLTILRLTFAQTKVITTGNNLVDPANPLAADIVIGSDQGTRHDASMMWWSNASASRISLTGETFFLSRWASTVDNANVGLAANN